MLISCVASGFQVFAEAICRKGITKFNQGPVARHRQNLVPRKEREVCSSIVSSLKTGTGGQFRQLSDTEWRVKRLSGPQSLELYYRSRQIFSETQFGRDF